MEIKVTMILNFVDKKYARPEEVETACRHHFQTLLGHLCMEKTQPHGLVHLQLFRVISFEEIPDPLQVL